MYLIDVFNLALALLPVLPILLLGAFNSQENYPQDYEREVTVSISFEGENADLALMAFAEHMFQAIYGLELKYEEKAQQYQQLAQKYEQPKVLEMKLPAPGAEQVLQQLKERLNGK